MMHGQRNIKLCNLLTVYHYNVLHVVPSDHILSQLSLYTLPFKMLLILCLCMLYGLLHCVTSDNITAMIIKFAIFWNVMLFRVVEMNAALDCTASDLKRQHCFYL